MQISSYPIAEDLSDNDKMILDQEVGTKSLSIGELREYFNISDIETSIKAGVIYPFASAEVPEGFLACDGAAYSREEYIELFAVIGTTYGVGDGSTTFNVPDLRGRTLINKSPEYNIGTSGGEKEHTLLATELPKDVNPVMTSSNGSSVATFSSFTSAAIYANGTGTNLELTKPLRISKNGGNPLNIMQPYTVVNYIISTGKGTGINVDNIIQGQNILPLSIENGGTGGTTKETALTNLGINDRIIAEGDSGIWHWVKYDSGWAECWGINTQNIVFTPVPNTGAINISNNYIIPDFPFNLISLDNIEVNFVTPDGEIFSSGIRFVTSNSTYQTRLVLLAARSSTFTVNGIQFKIHVSGFWK